MQERMNVLRFKPWSLFYMSVHVLLQSLNEMRKIDNMMFHLSYDIFAFACIDKSPYCQEFYLILLKNCRHIAAFV